MLMVPTKLRTQETVNPPGTVCLPRAQVHRSPSHVTMCAYPLLYSSLPCEWKYTWNLSVPQDDIYAEARVHSHCAKGPSQQTHSELGSSCALSLTRFKKVSTKHHCFLLTVSLHDILTHYCSCMNKSVFPNQRWESTGTGNKSCPAVTDVCVCVCGKNSYLYPLSLQVNTQQLLTLRAQF